MYYTNHTCLESPAFLTSPFQPTNHMNIDYIYPVHLHKQKKRSYLYQIDAITCHVCCRQTDTSAPPASDNDIRINTNAPEALSCRSHVCVFFFFVFLCCVQREMQLISAFSKKKYEIGWLRRVCKSTPNRAHSAYGDMCHARREKHRWC